MQMMTYRRLILIVSMMSSSGNTGVKQIGSINRWKSIHGYWLHSDVYRLIFVNELTSSNIPSNILVAIFLILAGIVTMIEGYKMKSGEQYRQLPQGNNSH